MSDFWLGVGIYAGAIALCLPAAIALFWFARRPRRVGYAKAPTAYVLGQSIEHHPLCPVASGNVPDCGSGRFSPLPDGRITVCMCDYTERLAFHLETGDWPWPPKLKTDGPRLVRRRGGGF